MLATQKSSLDWSESQGLSQIFRDKSAFEYILQRKSRKKCHFSASSGFLAAHGEQSELLRKTGFIHVN